MRVPDSLLRRHVVESNLIEGITAVPGEPEYDGHLAAARLAATKVVHPNQLHLLLARQAPGLHGSAGQYRVCGVTVGSHRMPRWPKVPELMQEWEDLAGQYQSATADLEEKADLLHTWLLCIHPWVDGNGRTARLVWNMLRVSKDLPWHIEPAATKHFYYAKIRGIEVLVFQKQHPGVY